MKKKNKKADEFMDFLVHELIEAKQEIVAEAIRLEGGETEARVFFDLMEKMRFWVEQIEQSICVYDTLQGGSK